MKGKWSAFIVVFAALWLVSNAFAEEVFYYHEGAKRHLTRCDTVIAVKAREGATAESILRHHDIDTRAESVTAVDERYSIVTVRQNESEQVARTLADDPDIAYRGYCYLDSNGAERYGNNELCVKLKESVSDGEKQSLYDQLGITVLRIRSGRSDIVQTPRDGDIFELSAALYESGLVEYAHPNFYVKIQNTSLRASDEYFHNQFHLLNTGQTISYNDSTLTATAGADIKVLGAWARTKGDSNITIAVFDDGVDTGHDDLDNLVTGRNFKVYPPNSTVTPSGNDAHGTMCAGIIGAKHDSNGVAGIAPDCAIMPIRILEDDDDFITPARVADAFDWAVANGANVISCSWFMTAGEAEINAAVADAINDDCVVVAAVGNYPNQIGFPAKSPGVIVVGATDMHDHKADYSIVSSYVDIAAPSGSYADEAEKGRIWTTDVEGDIGFNYDKVDYPSDNRSYTAHFNGTSAACPQVAAVAGLMLSADPTLDPYEVYDILTETADKVHYGDYSYSAGRCNEVGYGRLNATKAVIAAANNGVFKPVVRFNADYGDFDYYNTIDSGTTSADSGDIIYVVGDTVESYDVTIESGVTLEVLPGVTVAFGDDKTLEIDGDLYADNCTFTRSGGTNWRGLKIDSGGSCELNAVTISYANYGVRAYDDDVTISGTIHNCVTGVYIYYCSPLLDDVKIESSSMGVRMYGSADIGYINNATFDSDTGVYINDNSEADVDSTNFESIDTYTIDIKSDATATITDSNVIPGATYAIYNRPGSLSIDALGCWWGSASPNFQTILLNPNNVDTTGYTGTSLDVGSSYKIAAPHTDLLAHARNLEVSGKNDEAYAVYRSVISGDELPAKRRTALKGIMRIDKSRGGSLETARNIIRNELNMFDSPYEFSLECMLCETFVLEEDYAAAIAEYTNLLPMYAGTISEGLLLSRMAVIHGMYLENPKTAKEYADAAAGVEPGLGSLLVAYESADVVYDPFVYPETGGNDEYGGYSERDSDSNSAPAAETALLSVSPNPFNPRTVISYRLAESTDVELYVYSVAGQKVAEVVDRHMPAGTHSAVFNGAGLASGVYLYRFRAGTYVTTSRMLFVK